MCKQIKRSLLALGSISLLATTGHAYSASGSHDHHKHMQDNEQTVESKPAVTAGSNLPPPTQAEIDAAFPSIHGMEMHGHMGTFHNYIILDQLEWGQVDNKNLYAWDAGGWSGYDTKRFWWRTEGSKVDSKLAAAEFTGLYGKAISRWWEFVIGARHAFSPSDAAYSGQTFFALGFQGLAPQWFETEVTMFVGPHWQTLIRAEFEYEILFSQKLIVSPSVEIQYASLNDYQRHIGNGITGSEVGIRLRYEFTREFAPYIGINWEKHYGKTAAMLEADGEDIEEAVLLAGVRWWY